MPETARGHADERAPRFARSGLRCTCRGQDRFVADPSLAAFLAALMLFAAALGAHIGIARARAPFDAPEPQSTIARRQRFRAEHLGQARLAMLITGALLAATVGWLIAGHA